MRLHEVIILATILIALALMMLIKPHLLWKIENFLFTKGGQPSDLYLTQSAIIGALLLIGGLGFLFFGVLKFIL